MIQFGTHFLTKVFCFVLLGCISYTLSQAQTQENFKTLLEKGKAEFKKPHQDQNYAQAVIYLSKALQLQPQHAEARYFLGYAYDRFNSKDGESMNQGLLSTTQKASSQFEQVIKLTKGNYQGERVVLGPQSKISAIWGSMAMAYQFQNKKDSVIWALQEGKRRGGLGQFLRAYNQLLLDNCSKNAVLLVAGDNIFFPLMYLQKVEKYRTDVTVMDMGLLAASWYPKMLQEQQGVDFGLPAETRDQLQYCRWQDSTITIGQFSWVVKPSYGRRYLLRHNRLLLSFLQTYKFKQDVFMSNGMSRADQLSLQDKLVSYGGLKKIDHRQQGRLPVNQLLKNTEQFFKLLNLAKPYNQDEQFFVTNIGLQPLFLCQEYLRINDKKSAKQFLDLHQKYRPISKYPFKDKEIEAYFKLLKKQLE